MPPPFWAPAVNPILELLNKGESQLKGGNLQASIATLGGFPALWEKAAPVIQPLAGDQWPTMDSAAKRLIKTFGSGSPDQAESSSAITGLLGPLSGLVGK